MKKVLIIEDDSTLRIAYEEILRQNNYLTRTAHDGRQGLSELRRFKPDVILLDIIMPNMNGLQFLEKANVAQNHPETSVVAFSNLSNIEMLEEMLERGAHQHILKSDISPKKLLAVVEHATLRRTFDSR